MGIPRKNLLTVVAISIGIGALSGVAGHFLGLGAGVVGGATGAICAVAAVLLLRQPSQ